MANEGARLDLMRELPPPAQAQIWEESVARGVFPGALGAHSSELDLRFVLATFNPDLGMSRTAANRVFDSIVAALDRLASAAALSPFSHAGEPRTMRGLSRLGVMGTRGHPIHPKVLGALAKTWADVVLANAQQPRLPQHPDLTLHLPRKPAVDDELRRVLNSGIEGGGFTPIAQAALVLELATHDPRGATRAVLHYVAWAARHSTTPMFVRHLRPWSRSSAMQALNELFELKDRSRSMEAGPPSSQLRAFAAWRREYERSHDRDEIQHADLFFDCVAAVVVTLPSTDALTLGACYLRLHPRGGSNLAEVLLDRLRKLESTITEGQPPVYGRPHFAAVGDLLFAMAQRGSLVANVSLMESLHRIADNAGEDRAHVFFCDVSQYCRMNNGTEMPRALRPYIKVARPRKFWL
jgi:hypothetical protein